MCNEPDVAFGQRDLYTCAVACVSYVLCCFGRREDERSLQRTYFGIQKGYSLADVVDAVARMGLQADGWSLQGSERRAGAYEKTPWLRAGNELESGRWLVTRVKAGVPVIVYVDPWRLTYAPTPEALDTNNAHTAHAMVVKTVENEDVALLEVDWEPGKPPPKVGRTVRQSMHIFSDAWQAKGCLALAFSLRTETGVSLVSSTPPK